MKCVEGLRCGDCDKQLMRTENKTNYLSEFLRDAEIARQAINQRREPYN